MNVINAATTSALNSVGAATAVATVRSNGAVAHQHNTAPGSHHTKNEGYTALVGHEGSCSSSTVSSSSESEDHQNNNCKSNKRSIRLTFPPREESPCSSEADLEAGNQHHTDSLSDKTDCNYSTRVYTNNNNNKSSVDPPTTSSLHFLSSESSESTSSLNLSNPNINSGQYSSDDFGGHDAQYLYAVQSLEHDLDCILENRDLNPFYEDLATEGGSLVDTRMSPLKPGDFEDDCEFNVEDYLVDLDQYLDEQEQKTTLPVDNDPTLDRRILRKPNTNRTLPRKLRDPSSALLRDSAIRNSVHLVGKEPTGKCVFIYAKDTIVVVVFYLN